MPILTLKMGALEVSYDGDQKYIEQGLASLIKELSALPMANKAAFSPPVSSGAAAGGESGSALGHATSHIAQIVGVSSGGDLVLAAAAHLVLVQSKETFTRNDLSHEMKGATSFVTASYLKNLTPILAGLIKSKRLTPLAKDKFSLPASVRKEFEAKLASE